MNATTFTKNGSKATTTTKLPVDIFGLEVINQDLIKQAYTAYQANGRENLARTKNRGDVSGGGRKPWRQKGTGRARFGSIRVPIWRGGGVAHGPKGNENYSQSLPVKAKRQALRHALSIKYSSGAVVVLEKFEPKDGKVKETINLLGKIDAKRKTLFVVDQIDDIVRRATANIPDLTVLRARSLNVFNVMNADMIIISHKSLEDITEWLSRGDSKL